MRLGWQELLLVLLIVLVIFGGSRLPQLARGLGEALKEFKKAVTGKGDEPKKKG